MTQKLPATRPMSNTPRGSSPNSIARTLRVKNKANREKGFYYLSTRFLRGRKQRPEGRVFIGGPSATRTRDQLVKSQLLYRLS